MSPMFTKVSGDNKAPDAAANRAEYATRQAFCQTFVQNMDNLPSGRAGGGRFGLCCERSTRSACTAVAKHLRTQPNNFALTRVLIFECRIASIKQSASAENRLWMRRQSASNHFALDGNGKGGTAIRRR
jgi:hypothetical protein